MTLLFYNPVFSLFIQFGLQYALPKLMLSEKLTKIITSGLIAVVALVLLTNLSKAYTAVNYSFLAFTLNPHYLIGLRKEG